MKKIILGVIGIAITTFVMLSNDPLNDTVNFIIAGSIPGTKFSIGFWSTMLLAAVFLLIIRRAVKNARHKMQVFEVKKSKVEKSAQETNELEFDHSKRSIIAAPTQESVI